MSSTVSITVRHNVDGSAIQYTGRPLTLKTILQPDRTLTLETRMLGVEIRTSGKAFNPGRLHRLTFPRA